MNFLIKQLLCPIKNREKSEQLEELVLLNNQLDEIRLQVKLGKQNFHENTKSLFEPVTDTVKKSPKI